MIVCDTTNLESMVHCCKNCPGYPPLKKFIQNKFTELEIDEEMLYSQWKSIDRTTLQIHTADVDDFIKLLVYSVDKLATHSLIAKSQAQHLKQRKQEITETECIILMDFAENYHYVVQDEIWGYQWNKDQCTIHPVVIYFKNDGVFHHISLHIIYDLEHDSCFVHELNCREQSCLTSRRISPRSKGLTILLTAVLGSTRTTRPF